MEAFKRMWAGKSVSRRRKESAPHSSDSIERPRASTGGGGEMPSQRSSSREPGRASSVCPGPSSLAQAGPSSSSQVRTSTEDIGEAEVCYTLEHSDHGRLIRKEYIGLVDDGLLLRKMNFNLNSAGDVTDKRGSWGSIGKVYRNHIAPRPHIKQIVDRCGWMEIFSIEMPHSDHKFVDSVIVYWCDKTHTFHLPYVELGITPFDFTFLTGISTGIGLPLPEIVNTTRFSKPEVVIPHYFPGIAQTSYYRGGMRWSWLNTYLSASDTYDNVDAETIARAFVFYALHFFFPYGNNTIPIEYIILVEDINNIGKYDWGSAFLARMYFSLDTICREDERSLKCCWQIIEYLFYEYLKTSCPVLKETAPDTWPRVHRWRKAHHKKIAGKIRFKFEIARTQVSMRTPESVIWQPFNDSLLLDDQRLHFSRDLSLRRVLLLDPMHGATWYLGDRCYRQLTGLTTIPDNPPPRMSFVPRWEFINTTRENGNIWDHCQMYIIRCSQEQFNDYWAAVSVRSATPSLRRFTNIDTVGLQFMPTIPCTPVAPYQTYPSEPSSSQQFELQWKYEFINAAGARVEKSIERNNSRQQFEVPDARSFNITEWRNKYIDLFQLQMELRRVLLLETQNVVNQKDFEIAAIKAENELLRAAPQVSFENTYRPAMDQTTRGPEWPASSNLGFSSFANMPQSQFHNQNPSNSGWNYTQQRSWHGLDEM